MFLLLAGRTKGFSTEELNLVPGLDENFRNKNILKENDYLSHTLTI